jgi:hypothetical protein
MSKGCYHRFMISEHFEDIINKIDIKTETLIENNQKSCRKKSKLDLQDESHKRSNDNNELNKTRGNQLEKIKEIEKLNFELLSIYLNGNPDVFDDAFAFSDDYEGKIDRIKDKIICIECVLLDEKKNINGLKLIVLPFFLNENNLKFFK